MILPGRWPLVRLFRRSPAAQAREAEALAASRQSWLGRVVRLFDRSQLDAQLWDELEEALLAADVGLPVTDTLMAGLRGRASRGELGTPPEVRAALRGELVALLRQPGRRGALWPEEEGREPPRPAVVLVVGVNGTGKTTSIGKLAHAAVARGQRVIIAAADTFRAAADDQLRAWARRVGAQVVAHQPGADPGAVTFDALSAAQARGADLVIVDTAGRLHTKANLMEELGKVYRVIQRRLPGAPHEVLLVLDAPSGQNGLLQARTFAEAVGVTGVLLAKLDGSARGGIVFAVAGELGIPVHFIGTGEGPEDLAPFDPEEFVDALLAPP